MAFAAPALPFVQLGFSVVQAANQNAAGKYNQAVQNRNAQIAEQEARQIEKQTEVDLVRFDQRFNQLQGQTRTRILTSGADLSGSGLRIMHNNETQAQLERNTINYNSKIAQQSKFNEANFARIQGQVARQAGRAAAIGTLGSAAFSFAESKPGKTLLGNIPNPFA
jgi:cell division protein FtsL